MSYSHVYPIDMTFNDLRSIGSTLLLALTVVTVASVSGRLYQASREAKMVQAADAPALSVFTVETEEEAGR